MGGTISSLLPGRSVSGTLASLCVLFALAPAPAYAGVVSAPGNEAADSSKVAAGAAEQQCTVKFEHQYVGISEGIFAILFVVTTDDQGNRAACYQGTVTIQHKRHDNTEEDDYSFGQHNYQTREVDFAGSTDGTEAFSVNVHEDNDDDEHGEGLKVFFTETSFGGETVGVVDPDTMFITINSGGPRTPAPGAPQSLSATTGDGRVTLSWSPPASDGGATITGYEYRYAESSGTYPSNWTPAGGSGARSVTVSSLNNGTLYKFQVRAMNSVGGGAAADTSARPTSGGGTPSLSIGNATVSEEAQP